MEKLEVRKESLLDALVREYVHTAEPVGSLLLSEKTGRAVSAATVRSELVELEREGFLTQPHTSAGRVPTEQAYRYFVEHLSHPRMPAYDVALALGRALADPDTREGLKAAAKILANESKECVFVGFSPHDVYYTGLTQLFSKPEFSQRDMAINLSAVLDELDGMIEKLDQSKTPRALIGSENPLHESCGTVYASHGIKGENRLIGFFGLMRMDYEKIIGLMESVQNNKS